MVTGLRIKPKCIGAIPTFGGYWKVIFGVQNHFLANFPEPEEPEEPEGGRGTWDV